MAVLAALAMSLAMRPDSDSNPVMRFHLVTTWQRRSRSASVMSAQFHLGMGSQMRSGLGLGMGCYRRRRPLHHQRRRRPQE
jgi:hypothetical protein